jgi:hypothetical protein
MLHLLHHVSRRWLQLVQPPSSLRPRCPYFVSGAVLKASVLMPPPRTTRDETQVITHAPRLHIKLHVLANSGYSDHGAYHIVLLGEAHESYSYLTVSRMAQDQIPQPCVGNDVMTHDMIPKTAAGSGPSSKPSNMKRTTARWSFAKPNHDYFCTSAVFFLHLFS